MSHFTIFVLPGFFASGVAASLDVLRAAEALAPRMKLVAPTWRIVSPDGGVVVLSNGMSVNTSPFSRRNAPAQSTWIVPGLASNDEGEVEARLQCTDAKQLIRAISVQVAQGGKVFAACASVFLLQAAGVLTGKRVTTTWWLASALRKREPSCIVDSNRMVCEDGQICTAGAAFAQVDLMLHLMRVHYGTALSEMIGRVLLVDGRQAQADFVVPQMLSNGSEFVAQLIKRIESSLPSPPSIKVLATELAMSQRTLSRHVQKATGRSTIALVQSVRINRARMLIESSRMPIERVAEAVGYEDATALRRLIKKVAGSNPSNYRASQLR